MRDKKYFFFLNGKSTFVWAEKKMDIMTELSRKGIVITAPEIKQCIDSHGKRVFRPERRGKK